MRILSLFIFSIILSSCGVSLTKVLKSKDPEYKLRMAEQYYAKKKYMQAQQVYEDIIPYFKGRQQFEDIYYKYAYTAYYLKDYLSAENLFKTYIQVFPNSTRAEEIDYMRAYTFYMQSPKAELDQSNTIRAIGMMQTFINTHPGSARNAEATRIIDELRHKMEIKDFNAAQLYFDLGQFRAASVAFNSLISTYPDSDRSDEYKYMAIRASFQFAQLSVDAKKTERFEKVIEEANDFMDRFPQSSFAKEVEQFISLSQTNIKNLSNEPVKTST